MNKKVERILDTPVELIATGELLPEAVVFLMQEGWYQDPYLDVIGYWHEHKLGQNRQNAYLEIRSPTDWSSSIWEKATKQYLDFEIEQKLLQIRNFNTSNSSTKNGIFKQDKPTLWQKWERQDKWVLLIYAVISSLVVPNFGDLEIRLFVESRYLVSFWCFLFGVLLATPNVVQGWQRVKYYQSGEEKRLFALYVLSPFVLSLISFFVAD